VGLWLINKYTGNNQRVKILIIYKVQCVIVNQVIFNYCTLNNETQYTSKKIQNNKHIQQLCFTKITFFKMF